ncbi:MAG: hypothetical protein MJA29_04945 [Candidatus Omnitrophica bacterium]|nr:hypothetical protein [Candidatus Omnitrophota bacterium]
MNIDLSLKEKKFIDGYKKLIWVYLMLFFVNVFFVVFQMLYVYKKLIPLYRKTFIGYPEIQSFVELGIQKCVHFSIIWIVLLIGVLVGSFLTFRKVCRIFSKLNKA